MQAAKQIAQKRSLPDPEGDWETVWELLNEIDAKLPEFLYAIGDRKNGLVKFGRSNNPVARLKALRIGNGADLGLWGYCPHESPLTEREVHKRLKAFRVSGEWFRMTAEVKTVVGEIQRRD